MINSTKKSVKGLWRKLFNIFTPSILFLGAGLIATGMTIMYLNTLPDIGDRATRMMYLTQVAIIWIVFIIGIATHFTLWTDVEIDEAALAASQEKKEPQ